MKDYIVLWCFELDALQELVKMRLAEGWTLCGGVAVSPADGEWGTRYIQAMALPHGERELSAIEAKRRKAEWGWVE